MKKPNKNSKNFYTRACKRCKKLFRTTSKSSKICPDCDKKPNKIKNKFML